MIVIYTSWKPVYNIGLEKYSQPITLKILKFQTIYIWGYKSWKPFTVEIQDTQRTETKKKNINISVVLT
jgi:hypothetical protein